VLVNLAPRPGLYFGWIVGFVTLVVGLVITGLVPVAVVRSR
jgi:hypothetical protein